MILSLSFLNCKIRIMWHTSYGWYEDRMRWNLYKVEVSLYHLPGNADGQKHWPGINTVSDYQVQMTIDTYFTWKPWALLWKCGLDMRSTAVTEVYIWPQGWLWLLRRPGNMSQKQRSQRLLLTSEWSSPSWKEATWCPKTSSKFDRALDASPLTVSSCFNLC